MNKKKLIAKLLDKLSEEDLMELLGDEPEQKEEQVQETEQQTHIHSTRESTPQNKKRKGKLHYKKDNLQQDSKIKI